jgi:hypothetical protein
MHALVRLSLLAVLATPLLATSPARAGDCAIRVDRTPHAGKEAEAWGPYGNRNPTAELKTAKDAADCAAQAKVNCSIKRKDVLKAKAVKAKFDGADLDGGKDLCK